jgi:spermidine synthase
MTTAKAAKDKAHSATNWFSLSVIYLCFIFSGVAALIYQTAWTRQFSLVFGTSELAVAAVLAAYMGGLALGAFLIEKRIRKINRPVLWYAGLEVAIAVAAVALIPLGLWLAEKMLVLAFGGQATPPSASLGGTSLFYLFSAFAVLLVPTTLMGATLPLLARHTVHSEQQIGRRIGLLYAFNTAGAVAGALLGALLLLPKFGLSITVWIAAAINLQVGLLALSLSKSAIDKSDTAEPPAKNTPPQAAESWQLRAAPRWVLPLMLLSGVVSFLHEVLWSRMLGHVLGSSLYAFGVMLASFLAGIALGGGLGAWLAQRRESAARWLAISQLAAALAAIGAWYGIQQVSPAIDTLSQRVSFGFVLLFPLAFAIGLTYPLAVRVLASTVNDAAPASARIYSWNTVGAIFGAIAGGFLIVPALRYEGAVHLAVAASCLLAIIATFVLFRPGKFFAIPLTLAAIAAALFFKPAIPEALLRYSPLRVNGEGDLLYYDVGRSAAVLTLRQGNQIAVRTNSLPEASIDTKGSIAQLYVEAWMAPLAVLARPQLKDMLVVGLGGGRVVEAIPPSVRNIDVIELEDKVVEANHHVAAIRLRDPLADSRVNLILNDARGALQLTNKRYDAVVSQPSHPWTAGASHLYTREFMQQAKNHLNPGGLFVQWMNVDFLDESLLRSLVATVADVYPHVRVYRPAPPTLIFLASDTPIEPEKQIDATRAAFAASSAHYAAQGLYVVEDLLAALALDDAGTRAFANGAAVITDDRNSFATASVYDSGRNISAETVGRLLSVYDPLLQPNSFVYRDLNHKISYGYLGRRVGASLMYDQSARERLNSYTNLFRGTDIQAYLQAQMLNYSFQAEQAQQLLTAALGVYPDSELLRDAILESNLGMLSFGQAPAAVKLLLGKTSPIAALTLQGSQFALAGEWDKLAAIDDLLARVPWTSVWNYQAAQLRVEWRARVVNADLRPRLSEESIAIIDSVSLQQANPQLFLLRAWASTKVNKPHALLESIARYSLAVLQNQNIMDANMRGNFRNGITTLKGLVEELAMDTTLDKNRYAEVRDLFNQASQIVI